jgi:hypothetical protein
MKIKFLNYIQEANAIELKRNNNEEHIKSILEKDCQPMLRWIRKNKIFFARVSNKFNPQWGATIQKIKPRKNRRPLDTPPIVSKYIDNLFQNKFGWKPRSEGVFTLPHLINNINLIKGSQCGIFFPIGEFKAIIGEIDDLFMWLVNKWEGSDSWKNFRFFNSADEKTKEAFLNNIKNELMGYFTELDNYRKLSFRGETMFKCAAYYLIDVSTFEHFLKEKFI